MRIFLTTVALASAIAWPALAEIVGDPSLDNNTSNALGPHYYNNIYVAPPYLAGVRAEVIVPERRVIAPRPYPAYVGGAAIEVEPGPVIIQQEW
jgi:hypothetical protein